MMEKDPDLYTLDEENSERFYRIPKELFTNKRYKHLSSNAKVLYSILLDRKSLSNKNGWADYNKQVYLIYTRENIAEIMSISERTAGTVFKQLSEVKLIVEERQGLNKPNKIYIGRVKYDVDVKGQEIIATQGKQQLPTSYTDISDTEFNNNNIESKLSKYFSLYDKDKLSQKTNGLVIDVIYYYADTYRNVKDKQHSYIKEKQIDKVVTMIESIIETYNLDIEEWQDLIDEYFASNNHGDGNINRFVSGNELEGTIRGLLI